MTLKRTNSGDKDFLSLVEGLNAELWKRYPDIQADYAPLNNVDNLQTAIVAYVNDTPAGCGCFKKIADDTIEIKRMFTHPDFRGKGIAASVIGEIETWARELEYKYSALEFGPRQPEARSVYEKCGYTLTENYVPYVGMPHSICMKKKL
jgi:putative acetyltransferase